MRMCRDFADATTLWIRRFGDETLNSIMCSVTKLGRKPVSYKFVFRCFHAQWMSDRPSVLFPSICWLVHPSVRNSFQKKWAKMFKNNCNLLLSIFHSLNFNLPSSIFLCQTFFKNLCKIADALWSTLGLVFCSLFSPLFPLLLCGKVIGWAPWRFIWIINLICHLFPWINVDGFRRLSFTWGKNHLSNCPWLTVYDTPFSS